MIDRWNPNHDEDSADTNRTCGNCGHHITEAYERAFEIGGEVRCCPFCPDKVRRNGTVQDARSQRRSGRAAYRAEGGEA